MTGSGVLQLVIYLAVLVVLVKPLGWFMACVLEGKAGEAPLGLGRALGWLERGIYALCGIRTDENGRPVETGWKPYAIGMLFFNALGFIAVYALQRLQHMLPANPAGEGGLGAVEAKSAFNTAISFATNTNWQGYGGETTMSYLTQMLGLGVQNFLSAATGIAVLAALIRGLARKSSTTIGNCWADLTRVTLYILLPLSAVLAVALVSQGVVQTFRGPQEVALTVPLTTSDGAAITTQTIPLGPAASQIAIKQLGTNGGGFFNVNSAHPLENPTALSNFLQLLAILLIPAALCWTFGEMVHDRRQGWAVLAAMMVIFVPLLAATYGFEARGNPAVAALGVDTSGGMGEVGGNMEGKEARFGIANSALWAAATTAASNGSVNAMHDSYTPLGGLIPMWLMQLGEVVFGGVGSGLYGMLMFVIVAVFVAGLMVGRAPEYLGKKIEPFEMKMAMICVLVPCAIVLVGTAVAVLVPEGNTTSNPGPHGFSQILYAFSSAGNNNGSAFAGLSANTPFYNIALGLAMWFSRFWIIVPVLAVAGSLAAKRVSPTTGTRGGGTLPTHTPVFVVMLVAVVVIVGALTFVPALALGPVVEHLQLVGK
ncbi:MAG: potassium-transporting ATPase subunit KdpA [Planctomycetota bacterium]|nr:potassium-transporting ATPase subunit KdpA [Planctomycetota bacterium]